MDKIAFIDEYIEECNLVLDNKSTSQAKLLEDEILGVFSGEIENIRNRLDLFTNYANDDWIDYLGDISILRQKLINYKINIKEEKEKRAYDLEIAKLQQPNITAHAESHQSQKQSSNVNVNITIEQLLKQVDEISESNLNAENKETLKEYIYSLEGVKVSKDKNKFWDKTKEILRFLADKSADAAIVMLPYIIQGFSALNT